MARDLYQNTVVQAQADGTLKALGSVQVYVYLPGTQTVATIYAARTGVTTLANPILTGSTGAVEFWAEAGEYDVRFLDTQAPARIPDTTKGWNSVPGADGGLPTAKLAADGGLVLAHQGGAIQRQQLPLGAVIDWWRPNNTVDVGGGAGNPPPGFVICDGQAVLQANHDFGAIGTINVPDLRNQFVVGADIAKADGTAGTTGAAPGIRGAAGGHSVNVPAHYHGKGNLNITGGGVHHHEIQGSQFTNSGGLSFRLQMIGTDSSFISTYDVSVNGAHTHSSADFSGSVGATGGVNGDVAISLDNRPAHVGLLKIIKVKRS